MSCDQCREREAVIHLTQIVNEQVTLPLPSVGFLANYNITPKLQFQSRFDFFYLAVNEYTGSMFEIYLGLEYRLHQHFAMGAAYDRLTTELSGSGEEGFNVNFGYNDRRAILQDVNFEIAPGGTVEWMCVPRPDAPRATTRSAATASRSRCRSTARRCRRSPSKAPGVRSRSPPLRS